MTRKTILRNARRVRRKYNAPAITLCNNLCLIFATMNTPGNIKSDISKQREAQIEPLFTGRNIILKNLLHPPLNQDMDAINILAEKQPMYALHSSRNNNGIHQIIFSKFYSTLFQRKLIISITCP